MSKTDHYIYKRLNNDFHTVYEDIKRNKSYDLDPKYAKFIEYFKKYWKSFPNCDSIGNSISISINQFWILMIRLGFVKLENSYRTNTKNQNLIKRRIVQRKTCKTSSISDTEIQAQLWGKIWNHLWVNQDGFITMQNMKIYLAAILNLWFSWMKVAGIDKNNNFQNNCIEPRWEIIALSYHRTYISHTKNSSVVYSNKDRLLYKNEQRYNNAEISQKWNKNSKFIISIK